ncbi:hypothetical protein [Mesorhizobium sp. M0589]
MTDVARAERDQYFIACLAFNKALAVAGTARSTAQGPRSSTPRPVHG